jgi:hypothetical protein
MSELFIYLNRVRGFTSCGFTFSFLFTFTVMVLPSNFIISKTTDQNICAQRTLNRNSIPIVSTATTTKTATTKTMPLLSVSNATVTELFKGSAKFGRPSTTKGAGWIVTAKKGDVSIQKQINQDDNAVAVIVVRWTNYMKLDGLNGRILPGLPILRQHDSVYFKTSSTTTRGDRHKAPFCFKFETVDEAEEFEALWLLKNGSIASWKEESKKKKEGGISNNNLPLQETTNTTSTPVSKRKADPMVDGPLRKIKKVKDTDRSLNLVYAIGGGENVPALSDGRGIDDDANGDDDDDDDDDDGTLDPRALKAFQTATRIIVKVKSTVKRSSLKSIAEHSINNSNEEDVINLNDNDDNDNIKDSNEDGNNDDSSNDSAGEDVIIDEEDAPQSQNWMTAFASYE